MFARMRESRGFTLVELMIVVAIIGILAAMAVPYYQKHVQRSRLASLVWPGVHIVENNIGSYYCFNGAFPAQAELGEVIAEANTDYFSVAIANTGLTFTIKASGTTNPLHTLSGQFLVASVLQNSDGIVSGWSYSGTLATTMGLERIQ